MKKTTILIVIALLFWACHPGGGASDRNIATSEASDSLRYPQEKYLANMRQLTFGGDNAVAYFSFDDTKITFQSNNPAWDLECDQIFYVEPDKADMGRKLHLRR